jgi:hypothetical protein
LECNKDSEVTECRTSAHPKGRASGKNECPGRGL